MEKSGSYNTDFLIFKFLVIGMYVYVWAVCSFSVTPVLIYFLTQHCLSTLQNTMESQRWLLQPYSFCFVSVILTPLFLAHRP